jgi:type VI secretion system secreted protein VgrG
MGTYTQENRLLTVKTPLGDDVLLLTAFAGREELSRLFAYRLDCLSEKDDVAAKDLVGKPVGWCVQHFHEEPRYFHGVVSRFAAGGYQTRGLRRYRLEVVPWLWLLTRTTNCRIFQNKTVPQILDAVFGDLGFSDYEINASGTHPKREYCVQYRETAFDFASRLMEEEGLFYFFRHEEGKHTLVVADAKSAYATCQPAEVTYTAGTLIPAHIDRWDHEYEFRAGKWAQTDYNFETPATNLLASTNKLVGAADADKYEKFDYPGLYRVKGDGDALVKVRMEEEEAPFDVVSGSSQCATFSPGCKFTLEGHESEAENQSYVLTAVEHSASDPAIEGGAGQATYGNTFRCMPASATFRPARLTPRPVVQGPQTAVVVGPKGEEIYTDKYGRVKVQFFWDREGKKDENSSCWIRVAEHWAGKNWGMVFNPRIGQEVIVDFLEGDPDRPLITGRVYNAEQMPPYELPKNQTQSGVKTRSSKGGGADDFNELRFEDKKGEEDVYFHGQKDFHRVVENDDDLKVGHDQTISVKNNRTEVVEEGNEEVTIKKGDRTHTVHGNETITIETGDRTETVKQGNESVTVKEGNRLVEISQGNETLEVKQGNRQVTLGQGKDTHHLKVGDREVILDVGNDVLTIKTGNQTTKVNLGKCSTEALQGIELKCGPNSIKLEPSGITIKGMMVTIEGQTMTSVKGMMATVQANAILQLQGALTKIG